MQHLLLASPKGSDSKSTCRICVKLYLQCRFESHLQCLLFSLPKVSLFLVAPAASASTFKYQLHAAASSQRRICRPFMQPRNRLPAWRSGTTPCFSYRPARLRKLAELISGLLETFTNTDSDRLYLILVSPTVSDSSLICSI
jgi:hypothetical protein